VKPVKRFLLLTITGLNWIWRFIPLSMTKQFFLFLFVLESRGKRADQGLARLFAIEDQLNRVINERALSYGRNEHPKHRLIPYHQFFIDNLQDARRVLDVGCGYGAVARSIAIALPNAAVIGIDNDKGRLEQAIKTSNPRNLVFEFTDLSDYKVSEPFDAVVLSNVLEHVHDRISILKSLIRKTGAPCFLIRVPLFERHWTIALRSELKISYFQDDDHKIEHTVSEFEDEIRKSGLIIEEIHTLWGEIWAVCRPA
jgi:SAM-dependent methyltransferase